MGNFYIESAVVILQALTGLLKWLLRNIQNSDSNKESSSHANSYISVNVRLYLCRYEHTY